MRFLFTLAASLLILVSPLPSTVMAAEVEITGEAYVSGIYHKDYDFDKSVDTPTLDWAYWTQEFTINPTVRLGGGTTVYLSFKASQGQWGDSASSTYGDLHLDDDDLAYMDTKLGTGTLSLGRQTINWGHMFHYQGVGTDRIKYTVPAGESIKLGLTVDKITETADGSNNHDADAYGGFALYESEALSAGIMGFQVIDRSAPPDEKDGTDIDVYASAKIGSATLDFEAAYMAGPYNKDSQNDPRLGVLIGASVPVGSVRLSALAAYAEAGYTADDEFIPSLYIGTDQDTAHRDFGALDGDKAKLFALKAAYKLSDAVDIKGGIMYYDLSKFSSETLTEFDMTLDYTISDCLVWSFAAGYVKPDNFTPANDPAIIGAHTITVTFF